MNNDLLNADYPIPDPAWDYSQIWHHSQEAAAELQKLLKYMASVEDATPESDAQIKSQLDSIGQRLNTARRLIDS
jgi:cytochrome c556